MLICLLSILILTSCSPITQHNEPKRSLIPLSNQLEIRKNEGAGKLPIEKVASESNQEKNTSLPKVKAFTIIVRDFKERWNAITKELASNLPISSFNKVGREGFSFYKVDFNQQLELRVFSNEEFVSTLQLIGQPHSREDVYGMLTSWTLGF